MRNRLSVERIKERLKTKVLGKEIIYFKEIRSTQTEAKKLAKQGSPEGTMVIAEKQKKGKGRLERRWYSPEGGLWFSLILRPKIAPSFVYQLTLLTSLAIAETIGRTTPPLKFEDIKIKWPNDVLIRKDEKFKKVCGILTETSVSKGYPEWVVTGIGININNPIPKSLEDKAISLAEIGKYIDREKILLTLLPVLEKKYLSFQKQGFEPFSDDYRQRSFILGKQVSINTGSEKINGFVKDIDFEGKLILQLRDSEIGDPAKAVIRKIATGEIGKVAG